MNSRERVLAMLDGQPVDHLPLMPITMMFAADTLGVAYRQYATDHRVLVEAQLKTADLFGFDYVSVISDPAREAADLGATIEWFDNQPPAIVESQALLSDKADAQHSLTIPDLAHGRIRDRIEGVALLKQRVGDDRLSRAGSKARAPWPPTCRGVNTLMFDFTDDPGFVEALFEFVLEMELAFARAQVDAGADLIGVGDAASSLVGPRRYENFVLPYERRLVEGIQATGAAFASTSAAILARSCDTWAPARPTWSTSTTPCPMHEGRAEMGPDQTLLGNIDPVRVLKDGTPQSITEALAGVLPARPARATS